jgi:hypothetical protein
MAMDEALKRSSAPPTHLVRSAKMAIEWALKSIEGQTFRLQQTSRCVLREEAAVMQTASRPATVSASKKIHVAQGEAYQQQE